MAYQVEKCTICRQPLLKREIEAGNICVYCLQKYPKLLTCSPGFEERRTALVQRRKDGLEL
jgi:hypothetical protein